MKRTVVLLAAALLLSPSGAMAADFFLHGVNVSVGVRTEPRYQPRPEVVHVYHDDHDHDRGDHRRYRREHRRHRPERVVIVDRGHRHCEPTRRVVTRRWY